MRAIIYGIAGIVMALLSFGAVYALPGVESHALTAWLGMASFVLGIGSALLLVVAFIAGMDDR